MPVKCWISETTNAVYPQTNTIRKAYIFAYILSVRKWQLDLGKMRQYKTRYQNVQYFWILSIALRERIFKAVAVAVTSCSLSGWSQKAITQCLALYHPPTCIFMNVKIVNYLCKCVLSCTWNFCKFTNWRRRATVGKTRNMHIFTVMHVAHYEF